MCAEDKKIMRPPRFDNGMKKGAWSEDEDDKLRAFIQKYGHPNWCEIPKLAGLSRYGKSCSLRWMNYLRPNVKHGNFTKEEQDVIAHLHSKHGNKWSMMAAQLPGRSDNEIKNHWHTHLKNRVNIECTKIRNEQIEIVEPSKANPERCSMSISNSKMFQDEVGILSAVLSSNLPPSSSTSELTSLSGSGYVVPSDVSFWTEPFLLESEIHASSNEKIFSPLRSTNDLIYQASFQDYNIDDVLLW